jgi:hypothetical protein
VHRPPQLPPGTTADHRSTSTAGSAQSTEVPQLAALRLVTKSHRVAPETNIRSKAAGMKAGMKTRTISAASTGETGANRPPSEARPRPRWLSVRETPWSTL